MLELLFQLLLRSIIITSDTSDNIESVVVVVITIVVVTSDVDPNDNITIV